RVDGWPRCNPTERYKDERADRRVEIRPSRAARGPSLRTRGLIGTARVSKRTDDPLRVSEENSRAGATTSGPRLQRRDFELHDLVTRHRLAKNREDPFLID